MSDTHINAFYANVEEKKQAVELAKGELADAERLLRAHPDYQEPEKAPEPEPQTPTKPEVKTKRK